VNDAQILTIVLATAPTMLTVLIGILINNARLSDLRSHMDARFDEMRDTWRSDLRRVEEVIDARLRHLEERQSLARGSAPILVLVLLRHGAGDVRQRALAVLELDGRVMNGKTLAEHLIHAFKDGFACRRRHVLDQQVTAQSVSFRPEAPDVQVMHVDDARNVAQFGAHLR
jgi:hypothetical protein